MRNHSVLRSVLALALVLCMTLGIAVPALAADNDVIKYVSLGASNVNGLRMEGYYPAEGPNVYGYKQHCIKAYPYLFSKALEQETGKTVELTQLAISSFRAEEVHVMVDDNYMGDSYTEWRYLHTGTPEDGDEWFDHVATFDGIYSENNGIAEDDTALKHLRKVYQTALREADIVSIDVGMNNFGVYLFKRIAEGMMGQPTLDADLSRFNILSYIPNIDKFEAEIRAMLKMPAEPTEEDENMVKFLIDTILYAYLGLVTNFDASLTHIYAMNPDVEVVVVGLYNTASGTNVKMGDIEVPLGDIFGKILDLANTHMEKLSIHSLRTAYVNSDGRHNFFEQLTVEDPSYDKLSPECQKVMLQHTKELTGLEDPDQLLYATDVLTKIYGKAMSNNTIDLAHLNGLNPTDFITCAVTSVFQALQTGEIDMSFLEDEANKTMGLFFCRYMCLDWFFIHPDEQGHSDAAKEIMAVYKAEFLKDEEDNKCEEAIKEGMKDTFDAISGFLNSDLSDKFQVNLSERLGNVLKNFKLDLDFKFDLKLPSFSFGNYKAK